MAGVGALESEMPELITASGVEGTAIAPSDQRTFSYQRSRRKAAPERDDQDRNQGVPCYEGIALHEAEIHRGQNVHRHVSRQDRCVQYPSGQTEEELAIDTKVSQVPWDLLAKQIASKFVIARYRDDDEKIDVEDDPEDSNGAAPRHHHAHRQPTRCEVREESG